MKSKQEIRGDGKDWGCERENKEMSLDPRLVKAFVEEICDKTKTSRSLVQHDGQENDDLGKEVRLRCTWVGEEYYLNIGLIGGGCSAKSNSISSSMNNQSKGGGPRDNSTTFDSFNVSTC